MLQCVLCLATVFLWLWCVCGSLCACYMYRACGERERAGAERALCAARLARARARSTALLLRVQGAAERSGKASSGEARVMRCEACASESLNQVNIKIIAKKKAPAYCRSSDKKKIIKKLLEELDCHCTLSDERRIKCI